jgi:Family of unknown function (DUF5937)/Helix-turn-helix domain
MLTFEFTVDDLARTRFAISPLWELVTSLRLLQDPDLAGMHLPWVRQALPVARGLDLGTALAVTPSRGYIPDFLTPPPSTPVASFKDELELMRATPAKQVRNDVERLLKGRRPSARLRAVLDHPRREVNRMATSFDEYWRLCLEPHWPRVRALLDADLAHRSRRLTEGGPSALFADLSTAIRWSEARLSLEVAYQADVPLEGRGLLLVPSAFHWNRPAAIDGPPWQPTVLYPARGVGLLWEPGAGATPDALVRVLGRGRAGVLGALDAPRTTGGLSVRLEMTPGGVSQHLKALEGAGLVASRRQGRTVLYARTPLADELVGG